MNRIIAPLFSPLLITGVLLATVILFSHPNLGEGGLLIPINALVWPVLSLAVVLGVRIMFITSTVYYPRGMVLLLALPVLILLSALVSGLAQPLEWFMRISGLLLGWLFFFALFQLGSGRRSREFLLWLLLLGLFVQSLVGLAQLFPDLAHISWIPYAKQPLAIGMFQQVNVMATAMATAMLLAIWLISIPGFASRSLWFRLLPFAALLTSTAVLFSSGSRVGWFSVLLAVPLILWARFPVLSRIPRAFSLMLAMTLLGAAGGVVIGDGALRAYSKVERLAMSGMDARPHIYSLSTQLFLESPLVGYGIGSFKRVFHDKAGPYLAARDDDLTFGQETFSHPHNELLFWAVEGGVLAVAGLLLASVGVVIQLWRLGRQRGGAMAALLLPIVLHTQVEWPLYISAFHWALLLVLLYNTFAASGVSAAPLRLSNSAQYLAGLSALGLWVGVCLFCLTAYHYSHRIMYLLYSKEDNFAEVRELQRHPYFIELANSFMLRTLFYHEREQGRIEATPHFVEWAEAHLQVEPDPSLYRDLARAYTYMGQADKAQATLTNALRLFPDNAVLLKETE